MVYRIGLLGASRIAPPAVITPAKANPDFEVTAVAARDRGRAQAYADEHGVPGVADGYADLVARDDVDVVYNALPPAGRLEWTVAALEAGKAVLCEKPFCMDAGEARAMVAAAERTGGVLMEAAHYRYHDVIRTSERLLAEGVLGKITGASAAFNVPIRKTPDELRWRRDLGGGALMDLGFYPIHALRTLMAGEPAVTGAKGVFEDGVDTHMEADLDFGGAPARMACAMVAEGFSAFVRIEGERGQLEIVNFVAPQMGCRFSTTIDGETVRREVTGPSTYAAQLIHLGEVLDGKTKLLTGGQDSIANMTAIDAIYAAAGRPAWPT
jgi:predicted dehydrogenase